ncbi:C40 family peptidase [Adhaeribacter soli]|uniref:NlpC/P60 family protein n=1 Tax=Adhaeribacter soli TaxID=2607655 RepID=A0A5N1J451_9BACT|nr:C40 family peptidase [Adhaeribacter soli]KAA9345681.1 NlpC/P60 family protein [Adhaeribacter soli]
MKHIRGGYLGAVLLLFILVLFKTYSGKAPQAATAKPKPVRLQAVKPDTVSTVAESQEKLAEAKPKKHHLVEDLIAFGMKKIGTPYRFGGSSEKGFDCSGFVNYAFSKVGINVPRSSELLSKAGKPVLRTQVRRGDILIFTGTNSKKRTPGHVGIVISKNEGTISFVHASSNGGVKISEVEGTNYERRFLEVRRVL